jgi:hypothetical protein
MVWRSVERTSCYITVSGHGFGTLFVLFNDEIYSGQWFRPQATTGKFSDFSGDLRTFPVGKNGKSVESHQKKSEDFRVEILLSGSIDLRCFPEGTGLYFLIWAVSVLMHKEYKKKILFLFLGPVDRKSLNIRDLEKINFFVSY